mgnify:FL=1
MIKQKIFLINILITLSGCGFNPIYTNKNIANIKINKVVTVGNKKINRELLSLLNIKKTDQIKDSYVLNIETKKIKQITAKDKSGNVSIFNIYLEAVITLKKPLGENGNIKTKTFSSNFSYNNQKNKFELSREEDNIETNLIENIARKIILFIYS